MKSIFLKSRLGRMMRYELCRAGYIDSWGRGVEKIVDACKEANLPNPQFSERSGGMLVELTRSQVKTPAETRVKTISETSRDDFGKNSERIRKEFGMELAKAFEIICCHPEFTAEQIAKELDKTSRTVENYLAKLKKAGFIVRKGPKLGGHWEVKE